MHATPGLLGKQPDPKYPKVPEARWMSRKKKPSGKSPEGLKKT
jgi:hypothetical protein